MKSWKRIVEVLGKFGEILRTILSETLRKIFRSFEEKFGEILKKM